MFVRSIGLVLGCEKLIYDIIIYVGGVNVGIIFSNRMVMNNVSRFVMVIKFFY